MNMLMRANAILMQAAELHKTAGQDPRGSLERLALISDLRKTIGEAFEHEILELARQDVAQNLIAGAAGLSRSQVNVRERAAGMPPRRRGTLGGRISETCDYAA